MKRFHIRPAIQHIFQKPLSNGDFIEITWLPSCRNAPGFRNPYIGMKGEVKDLRDGIFHLFTGNSWLCGVRVGRTCYRALNKKNKHR